MVWNKATGDHRGFPKRVLAEARKALPMHCADCGATGRLELDHMRAHSQGGTDTLDNAQWLCPDHHRIKTLREAAAGRERRADRRRLPTRDHPGLA